jgi:hypothetical protein
MVEWIISVKPDERLWVLIAVDHWNRNPLLDPAKKITYTEGTTGPNDVVFTLVIGEEDKFDFARLVERISVVGEPT